MKTRDVCFLVFVSVTTFFAGTVKSQYATCGSANSDHVRTIINVTVNRLMELRNPSWGWINTPEAVIGLQLSAQRSFFARNRTLEQMKKEIGNDLKTMNIGKLAQYVLAVRSSCEDPTNFGGRNLVSILEKRSREQFNYNGSKSQIVPFDRYYRMGLALGALCVTNEPTKHWVLRRVLRGLDGTNNFGGIHSADDAAQVLLALRCIERSEIRPRSLMRRVRRSANKLAEFLVSRVKEDDGNYWIGNKYSSPHSALALKEKNVGGWSCKHVMKSLTTRPLPNENVGALAQRLPALGGKSYLELKFTRWDCRDTVPIPDGYRPICDPENPQTCNPKSDIPVTGTIIDVQLTIFTYRPPSASNIPNTDVTVQVQNGTTLFNAMVKARNEGLITFESRSTAWGQSITSMQGVTANSTAREYWSLVDGATGLPLPQGASSYIPSPGQRIVFRLSTW